MNNVLSQIAGGVSVVVSIGRGFTIIVMLWVSTQVLAERPYVYVTVTGCVVLFTSVSLMLPVSVAARLVMPGVELRIQVKAVPVVALAGM